MRGIFIIFLALSMLVACSKEPDCTLGRSQSTINVRFYAIEDSSALFMKFLSVKPKESDSIFYKLKDSLSGFTLALNPARDQVTYVFTTATSRDTLTMHYTRQLEWLSEECGPSFSYDQLDVVGSSFKYDLASPVINTFIDENIKIYR